MASVKDMLFQLTELKRDNDDLKEQNSLLVAQQSQMLQQHAWFSQQINWFQKQLMDTQAQFGDCYQQFSLCSLELYHLKTSAASLSTCSVAATKKLLKQEPLKQEPLEQSLSQVNQEWNQMLAADVESHQMDRLLRIQEMQMLKVDLENHQVERQLQQSTVLSLTEQKNELTQQKEALETKSLTSKKQALVLERQLLELSACLEQSTRELQQRGNQLTQVKKQLKEEQDKLKNKNKEARNQQETIHTLQNNLVKITEQLAEAESFVKSAKSDVALATDLSNGLSNKCLKLQEEHKAQREEHKAHIETLNGIVDGLKQQLEGQRASTKKLVQRAVEQQKTINKLSKVSVVFQADAETTESVIKESYTDLQKFIEEKALQMERIVALVAYAIVHLKYVLERFVTEQFEEKTPENIMHKEFLNQIVNHLTRVFQLVPTPVMTRNIDRLEEFAALEKINIRSLHVIQYMLPLTIEDAKASRQRVVLENFPHLNKFFIDEHCTNNDSISMSVQGFMMLLGISK